MSETEFTPSDAFGLLQDNDGRSRTTPRRHPAALCEGPAIGAEAGMGNGRVTVARRRADHKERER